MASRRADDNLQQHPAPPPLTPFTNLAHLGQPMPQPVYPWYPTYDSYLFGAPLASTSADLLSSLSRWSLGPPDFLLPYHPGGMIHPPEFSSPDVGVGCKLPCLILLFHHQTLTLLATFFASPQSPPHRPTPLPSTRTTPRPRPSPVPSPRTWSATPRSSPPSRSHTTRPLSSSTTTSRTTTRTSPTRPTPAARTSASAPRRTSARRRRRTSATPCPRSGGRSPAPTTSRIAAHALRLLRIRVHSYPCVRCLIPRVADRRGRGRRSDFSAETERDGRQMPIGAAPFVSCADFASRHPDHHHHSHIILSYIAI